MRYRSRPRPGLPEALVELVEVCQSCVLSLELLVPVFVVACFLPQQGHVLRLGRAPDWLWRCGGHEEWAGWVRELGATSTGHHSGRMHACSRVFSAYSVCIRGMQCMEGSRDVVYGSVKASHERLKVPHTCMRGSRCHIHNISALSLNPSLTLTLTCSLSLEESPELSTCFVLFWRTMRSMAATSISPEMPSASCPARHMGCMHPAQRDTCMG